MKVTKQYRWLKADDFKTTNPITAAIVAVEVGEKGAMLLKLVSKEIGEFQTEIYRDGVNALIDKAGSETDQWMDRRIQILRTETPDGKVNKKIIVL